MDPFGLTLDCLLFAGTVDFFSLVLSSIAFKEAVTMSRFKSLASSGSRRMSLRMMIIVIERRRETGHGN